MENLVTHRNGGKEYMFLKNKTKGYVEIKGSVDISDPSYDKDCWCRINDVQLKPGTYRCRYYTGSELTEEEKKDSIEFAKKYGKDIEEELKRELTDIRHRCFVLELQLKGRAFGLNSPKWEKIGEIGVDAGLAGFFWNKPDDRDSFCEKMGDFSKLVYLDEEMGFWSNSGYGDGWYPVYAIKEKEEIIAVKICY